MGTILAAYTLAFTPPARASNASSGDARVTAAGFQPSTSIEHGLAPEPAENAGHAAENGRENGVVGFYFFRLRYLDPAGGRWVSRDPLGIWGDAGQVGNAYSAFGNDPVNRVDPWGLAPGLAPAPIPTPTPTPTPTPGAGGGGGVGPLGTLIVVNLLLAVGRVIIEESAEILAARQAELAAANATAALDHTIAVLRATKTGPTIPVPVERPKEDPKPDPKPQERPRPEPKEKKEKPKYDLALGVGESWAGGPPIIPLIEFAAAHNALPFWDWPSEILGQFEPFFAATWPAFQAGFAHAVNTTITKGGWIYFNLAGIDPCATQKTWWELQHYLNPLYAHWWARTRFYDNEQPLTQAEAAARIAQIAAGQ